MGKQPDHDFSSFFSLLPSSVEGEGGTPLRLEVVVTTSDEVLSLRARVKELEEVIEGLRSEYNRIEYLYRCESIINQRLIDRCREVKVNVRDILRGSVEV